MTHSIADAQVELKLELRRPEYAVSFRRGRLVRSDTLLHNILLMQASTKVNEIESLGLQLERYSGGY